LDGSGDVSIRAGIAAGDFANAGSASGFILGMDDSDSNKPKFYIGSATNYLKWDGAALSIRGSLNADDITAGTLEGRTVKATGGAGVDVVMDSSDGKLKFKYGGSEKAYIYCDSSGNLNIDADDFLYLTADGDGDDIYIGADDAMYATGADCYLVARGAVWIEYNENGGSDIIVFANDGDAKVTIRDNGDMHVEDGDMYFDSYITNDYAEYFEATKKFSNKKIPTGTSIFLDNGLVRPAKNDEIPFGVISETSFIHSGGAGNSEWKGKYLRDELGRSLTEKKEKWYIQVKEKFKKETGQKGEKKVWKKGWSDEKKPPKGSLIRIKDRPVINPEYRNKKKYVKREDRPEWNNVGLLGQVPILKGQPTNPNWIKMKNLSDKYEMWLIK